MTGHPRLKRPHTAQPWLPSLPPHPTFSGGKRGEYLSPLLSLLYVDSQCQSSSEVSLRSLEGNCLPYHGQAWCLRMSKSSPHITRISGVRAEVPPTGQKWSMLFSWLFYLLVYSPVYLFIYLWDLYLLDTRKSTSLPPQSTVNDSSLKPQKRKRGKFFSLVPNTSTPASFSTRNGIRNYQLGASSPAP